MSPKMCTEPSNNTKTTADNIRPSNNDCYAKLIAAEKVLRSEGFKVRLVSEDALIVEQTCKSGHQLKLEATAKEKSISFQICLPLDFKSESKEVLSTINQLNDYSRQNDLCEFWAMGYRGKIYLHGALIDDGLFDKMNNVVTYLVSNLLEFAEYGLGMLSNTLQSNYVPSPTEYTEMYR